MALTDPLAVYNAANNVEAHLICNLLVAAGIEAHVIEDLSYVGHWIGGLVPEIYKAQVWVERADAERAKPILDDYECRQAERRHPNPGAAGEGTSVEVLWEECGAQLTFPGALLGSVQQCPRCAAYVDVVGEEGDEDWSEAEEVEPEGEP